MPTALTGDEIVQRVIGQRLVRDIGRAERRRVEQDGVAVRIGARRLADADGAAGARLVSMTIGWPICFCSCSSTIRAVMSLALPGANGMIAVMLRDG